LAYFVENEIREQILDAFNNKNPENLIELEAEEIIQTIELCNDLANLNNELTDRVNSLKDDLITYRVELSTNQEIKKLEELLNKQEFRIRFKNHAQDNTITNATIDSYLGKSLTPERAADAYNSLNLQESIPANEINEQGVLKIDDDTYNLKTLEGLVGARQARKEENYIEVFLTAPKSPVGGADCQRITEYPGMLRDMEILS